MLLRVRCAVIFNNGQGAVVCQKLILHHGFEKGDALSFICFSWRGAPQAWVQECLILLLQGHPRRWGSYTSPSAATFPNTDRDYLLDSSQQSWDSSSVEVFEEVLWRGGSVVWLTTLGGGGVGTKVAGVDPPVMAVGGIPITTYSLGVARGIDNSACSRCY
ncbi:UNVERIFIED_CONTAM: hypothetical protein Sradi_5182900 [Sesamum radiatum]|uniref:Uncharacterized protein n=1 Tax=Sesamum radiatum TaxID=300843 RepID=A0AAW2M6N8_SESRA